ncbi:hypothetical protein [Polaribacter sp. Hel1_85]|uniref:hypothetical protein n=1 Tax=Polaribacter sp. Hel1_85 TaxID=1250005 RepID=UPI00052BA250|nr:hypothetical protein [Polaribacter sp. Hel1_85]KGL59128.1 hypothetical protein PHEL85_3402 [Polaribacter sp. Hel1_85]
MKFLHLFLLLFIGTYCSTFSKNNDFYFNVEKEGFYKAKVPSNLKGEKIYLYYQNTGYQLDTHKNYAYFYCPSKGNYKISSFVRKLKSPVISFWKIIQSKKYYKYALSNSLNSDHWFTDIISDGKPFKATFDLRKK